MNIVEFAKIAESLRQYRRAELKDFENEVGERPVDQLYVDPLPGDAVLTSILSGNTTFLLGRKGTGKSTVFAKAQSTLREKNNIISVYLDVKSICDVLTLAEISEKNAEDSGISIPAYKAHLLRKTMLAKVISELLKEVSEACESMSLWDRWTGQKKQFIELKENLSQLANKVKSTKLEKDEVPILQRISKKMRVQQQAKRGIKTTDKLKSGIKAGLKDLSLSGEGELTSTEFDDALDDSELYDEYSDVVLKSFPFDDILTEIQTMLGEAKLNRLVVFFDDFSELNFLDQRLFVDVILSPLNNASKESVKLKIAGYPGRVYYGRIDPSKTDTIALDFVDLYEANEIQDMEKAATDYASRLLHTRFKVFGLKIEDYFDTSSNSIEEYMGLMFRASFNVPRIMGHILHHCYLDKISKRQKITGQSIRLASKKYYEGTTLKYFEKLNRYALEPFENKMDRHNQKTLLDHLVLEARSVRKKITDGEIGGKYFSELGSNLPISHFTVSPELEDIFSSLESNFFLSRYKNTRDKDSKHVIVYAFFMGLTESERMAWGYPDGRQYRNYFVQRCFDFSHAVHDYLASSQTIRCANCEHCHPMEDKKSIERFGWRCPECFEGICAVVSLSDDFKNEVDNLNKDIMLEPVEIEIITVLKDEGHKMPAGEIAALLDVTHQLVGRRTGKLQEMGLVDKVIDEKDGRRKSSLTDRCERTYFEMEKS
ncbi:regulatory protein MarR [Pseudomonas sp. Os17]|uniref:MarR family transcriptional regulator n=1 Tax=Pseudomonas TaxID=286 RepID=UPI0005FCB909|nr:MULTISPECIES: MarR family transcriptional regulator [Pseudomonas]RXU60182.1 transcriptional regulator [Pseudomonas protegens]BAQ74027.1 regulatory protein MarR [Pseudomonas sp. Os17]